MRQLHKGISGFTRGLRQTTWKNPSLQFRLTGFAVAVAAVAFLIVEIDSSIWREQGRLEQGFAAIKAEKFYVGVNLRVRLRKLSDSLLDYHLTANPADRELFREGARDLKAWLESKKTSFAAQTERDAFLRLEGAYGGFLSRVAPLVRSNGSPPVGPEGFAAAYAQLKQDYGPVLRACEDLVQAERDGFDVFLRASDRGLLWLQRLFMLSLLLLVVLAVALGLLVYRGMIAPLRTQLSESQALIARQEKLASLGALGGRRGPRNSQPAHGD